MVVRRAARAAESHHRPLNEPPLAALPGVGDMPDAMMDFGMMGMGMGMGMRGLDAERLLHRSFFNRFGDNFDDDDLD